MPQRRRDPADNTSAMCLQGQHGRCGGWLIVPNFDRRRYAQPDISVKCWCPECKHPEVARDRHVTDPPKGYDSGIH